MIYSYLCRSSTCYDRPVYVRQYDAVSIVERCVDYAIFLSREVLAEQRVEVYFCRMTFSAKDRAFLGNGVHFREVKDKDRFEVGDMQFQCFDILSTKEKQFGFRVELPGGLRLVCLGDEPYNEANRSYVEGADWLLCEAFCLYRDRDIFKPYEKHHSTALEAGSLAEELRVKNLLLYHTEDRNLATRKELYRAEALLHFTGRVFVPDDLETVELS